MRRSRPRSGARSAAAWRALSRKANSSTASSPASRKYRGSSRATFRRGPASGTNCRTSPRFSRMKRREFLLGGASLALASRVSFAQPKVLRASITRQNLVGAAHPSTEVWSYNASVPGPELRFKQGERLRVEVENALPVQTTVHWHGIRLPNAMDGVPGLTQAPIAANGGKFVYEFDLPDAGTYWYHPHLGGGEQLGRGLYGALIVEERDPPAVDRDVVWMLSDWRLDREARIRADFGNAMDASHAGRIGNTVTVNGTIPDSFHVRAGERVRLRLVNASSARIYALSFEGHEPWVIAL